MDKIRDEKRNTTITNKIQKIIRTNLKTYIVH